MKRRTMAKLGWFAGVVTVALLLQAPASFAAKGIVKIHEGDYTGNLVFAKLAEIILSEHMDYKVKAVPLPTGTNRTPEAIKFGDVDIIFESWPSYSTIKEKYITEYWGNVDVELFGRSGVVGQSG